MHVSHGSHGGKKPEYEQCSKCKKVSVLQTYYIPLGKQLRLCKKCFRNKTLEDLKK